MKKINSYLKKYSFLILPGMIFITQVIINKFMYSYNNIDYEKITVLVGVSGTLIGVLLTILTVYISFPKNSEHMTRVRESGHHNIFLTNVNTGIMLYTLSILIWLFSNLNFYVIAFFICGLSNTLVAGYYLTVLTKYA